MGHRGNAKAQYSKSILRRLFLYAVGARGKWGTSAQLAHGPYILASSPICDSLLTASAENDRTGTKEFVLFRAPRRLEGVSSVVLNFEVEAREEVSDFSTHNSDMLL